MLFLGLQFICHGIFWFLKDSGTEVSSPLLPFTLDSALKNVKDVNKAGVLYATGYR